PIDAVWKALTDVAAMEEWAFGHGGIVDGFEPVVGNRFTFTDPQAEGWSGRVECVVLELEAPRRLRYSWEGDGVSLMVAFALSPPSAGTRLRLVHSGFDRWGELGRQVRESLEEGWGVHVLSTSLRTVIEKLAVQGGR